MVKNLGGRKGTPWKYCMHKINEQTGILERIKYSPEGGDYLVIKTFDIFNILAKCFIQDFQSF